MVTLDDILKDVGKEMDRMGTLGRAEAAAALFGGNAFVQYGDGQHAVTPHRDAEKEAELAAQQPEPEPDLGMEL